MAKYVCPKCASRIEMLIPVKDIWCDRNGKHRPVRMVKEGTAKEAK